MKKLEKILTDKLDLCVSKDYLDEAINICEKNLPFMRECKNKRQMIVFTLSDNPDYCYDLVEYYLAHDLHIENESYYINQFKNTLAHDLLGLYDKDENFVPRINNQTV
tara:strand:- start:6905 stop:7228 length:324 start_codon:yes stop_codon:yes gene_type:complete